ncbi:zinc ribbon domain-containing protein [Lacticaseibacillus paracasei]|uniref:Zinc-ribbon domain-containing protein n=3 Tax=Lacticaseibacillus paracasei TaxID=1597 RepID=A0A8E0IPL7_LACPA|nr:zinc ribbon domain-containing protein [Lacticaseibacillus paracasei]EPC57215.1 hypothetical protein Lpp77_00380 [Lacticaseibacillus paracasei subsp. paracasei CNCM I-4270]EPD04904.1 hypothetical protein Lpp78_08480 [Lacticaseibacillus paracasei subsp. paracasei CNCM I-2877]OUC66628.1 hypothetical protein BLL69_2414c [Lacticaseibacillus paracasei]
MAKTTKICWNCGAKVPRYAKFCTKCGADLRKKGVKALQYEQSNLKFSKQEKDSKDIRLYIKTRMRLFFFGILGIAVTLTCWMIFVKNVDNLINNSFVTSIHQWIDQGESHLPTITVAIGTFFSVTLLSLALINRRTVRFLIVSMLFGAVTTGIASVITLSLTTYRVRVSLDNTLATDRLKGSTQLFTLSFDHYLKDWDETDPAYDCGVYTFREDGTLIVNTNSPYPINEKLTPQDAFRIYKEDKNMLDKGDKGTWRVSDGILFLDYDKYRITAVLTIPYSFNNPGDEEQTISGHKFDAIQLSRAGNFFGTSKYPSGKLSITYDGDTYNLNIDTHGQKADELTLYSPSSLMKLGEK